MFIHKSLDDPKFLVDKKLNLLRNNIITFGQFINLLDINDPYTIIGPALIDKTKISEFMEQCKNNQQLLVPIQQAFVKKITQTDVIQHLNRLTEIFPQIEQLSKELGQKVRTARCPICQRNKYILQIVIKIHQKYLDGRNLYEQEQFIKNLVNTYIPFANKLLTQVNINQFDIDWLRPDELVALGQDLIIGLINCFECCKKHLSRAKILFEEWQQKYPDHGTLLYNQFIESNKDIQQGYSMFWDSLGQIDMASGQLVGNLTNLTQGFQIQIINLANDIRKARILFQQDSKNVPDFDSLRLNVQKIENKIKKLIQKEVKS